MTSDGFSCGGRLTVHSLLYLLLALSICVACCKSDCGPKPLADEPPPPVPEFLGAPFALTEPLSLCAEDSPLQGLLTAQLLIDASGSMRGFFKSGAIPRTSRWVSSSIGSLATAKDSIHLARVATFDARAGLTDVTIDKLEDVTASGDTAIHKAVEEASATDLTFILTDGVPFDPAATGDCVTGADTGCLASRLLSFVTPRSAAGLWIVPLVGMFDGAVFPEGQEPIGEPTPRPQLEAKIQSVFPLSQVTVTLPASREAGDPILRYRGPKTLALFVLASNDAAGRAVVRALLQRAPLSQVSYLGNQLGAFESRRQIVATLTPIEVYPGYFPPLLDSSSTRDEDSVEGTIETAPIVGGQFPSFRVGCRKGNTGTCSFKLSFYTRSSGSKSCVDLHTLAATSLTATVSAVLDVTVIAEMGHLVSAIALENNATGYPIEGRLFLACPGMAAVDCAATPGLIEIAAENVYGGVTNTGGAGIILALSTTNLPEEPFKILGFFELIEQFLQGLPDHTRRQLLGEVSVCQSLME